MTSVPPTQPPAAPETDVRLTEAERSYGRIDPSMQWRGRWYSEASVERIVAERVRVVEGERDEYVSSICFETTCTNCAHMLDQLAATQELEDGDHIEAAKSQRIKAQQRALVSLRDARNLATARAESAEAAHRALQAAVEALADEWEADQGRTWIASLADDLRALLAGGEER